MRIILASASPRRRELLEMLGARGLTILPPRGGEAPCEGMDPAGTVQTLSHAKAQEILCQASAEDVVIAADTIVCLGGEKLGKPRSADDAREMLHRLSGRTHEVYTGVTVCCRGAERVAFARTYVRFRTLTDTEIEAYIATGEPMDKAGAYGIQGRGSLFVEGIDGDYFNVVGLPLCLLGKLLRELGVEAWNGFEG